MESHNFVTNDFTRDVQDYTSVVRAFFEATRDHITAGAFPNNPELAKLLERTGIFPEITHCKEESRDYRQKYPRT